MAKNKISIKLDDDSMTTKVECILDDGRLIESLVIQTVDLIQLKW
ncbi:hypothetical protein ACRS8Y_01825 [Bacillus paranthracis]